MWRAFTRQAASAAKRACGGSRSAAGGAAGTQLRTIVSGHQATGFGSTAGLGLMAVAASEPPFAAFAPVAFAGSVQERSFIMIKPDGVQRGLVAAIIKRFEDKGYKLVGIKVLVPTEDIARQHYMEHDGKPFYPGLVKFLTSGPVVAMVWEGKEVIKTSRTIIGATNPLASVPGTIRGDYGVDVGRNIIHGSDGVDSAQKEIALWFTPKELAEYEKSTKGWIYESAL